MTNKEKIKAKIEQLMYGFNLEADIASCEDVETEKLANIKYQVCKKILEYIDSLQEEPVSDDLEEAASAYAREEYDIKNPSSLPQMCIGCYAPLMYAFKAGANWQKEDKLFTETKIEKELAECYLRVFDKKFTSPKINGKQLHDFKNFINTCEQTFSMKYFDYHATQGKLFEKLALLWAVWGKEHLSTEVKDVDLQEEIDKEWEKCNPIDEGMGVESAFIHVEAFDMIARHFFELGLKAQKGE